MERLLVRRGMPLLAAVALMAAVVAVGPDEAVAADVTVSSNTTYSTNQVVDTLTVSDGVRLILSGSANLQVANLVLGSGSSVRFDSADAQITLSGTATFGANAQVTIGGGNTNVTLVGGTWNVTGSGADIVGNVNMDVAALTLCGNCTIDANLRGYGTASGPGAGRSYGGNGRSGYGAAHGGNGQRGRNHDGVGVATYYGSALQPTERGSGGGTGYNGRGGKGGGAIRIQVAGTMNTSGTVRANAESGAQGSNYSYAGGGGAGGSIWVTTGSLTGTGVFQAIGGSSAGNDGGAGAGGRIAVHFGDWTGFTNPQGSSAAGGSGYGGAGGLGTLVFVHDRGAPNDPTDDDLYAFQGWRWQSNDGPFQWRDFKAYQNTQVYGPDANGVELSFGGTYELGVSADWFPNGYNATLNATNFIMRQSSRIVGGARHTTLNVSGQLLAETVAEIESNRFTVTGTSIGEFQGSAEVLSNNIQWTGTDLTMSATAELDTDYRGYGANSGPGAGVGYGGNGRSGYGASHGGYGKKGRNQDGQALRPYYSEGWQPTQPGSGGGTGYNGRGGSGGGVIRVQLGGTLVNNGRFGSNASSGAQGSNYSYAGGGGAGGSIWVTATTVAGSGRFEALGGGSAGNDGGAGSGGRVFVEYDEISDFTNPRLSSVRGGSGYGGEADPGTLAFYDRDDNDMWIVEGWRWQANDRDAPETPITFRNLTVTDSTRDNNAWVRDDGTDFTLIIDNELSTDHRAFWQFTADAVVETDTLTVDRSNWRGTNRSVTIDVGSTATLTGASASDTSVFDISNTTITGDGDWTLSTSSQIISENLVFDDAGSIELLTSAFLRGNIRGTVADLRLSSTNTYITADVYGYGQSQGPGAGRGFGGNGRSGYGGSHGGRGARGNNHDGTGLAAYYDSPLEPTMAGSGGGMGYNGRGGNGGGVVNLTVRGEFLNNGNVRANGGSGAQGSNNSYAGGGGAGGSIWVTTNTLAGTGNFQAIGGSSAGNDGGGGAGGRIAVHFSDWSNFTQPQNSSIAGGSGTGGAAERGTLVFVDRGANLGSRVDDTLYVYQGWRWENDDAPHNYANFYADTSGGQSAWVRGPDTANMPLTFTGTYELKNNALWQPSEHDTTLTATHFGMGTGARVVAAPFTGVNGNTWLYTNGTPNLGNTGPNYANAGPDRALTMNVSGNFTMAGSNAEINSRTLTVTGTSAATLTGTSHINSDDIQWSGTSVELGPSATFNTNARGYIRDSGPGAGVGYGGNGRSGYGASHGGYGTKGRNQDGQALRRYYGSATQPTTAGSGGGTGYNGRGGAGGGVIRVQLTGTLDIDGIMRSNAASGAQGSNNSYAGGGGAGGSIWVTTDRLTGSGRFQAIGGDSSGNDGGGGAGGRIFVDYRDPTGFANPQLSTALGEAAHGGTADYGTVAFYERDVRDLWIVGGWRWEQGDAPFSYRNLKVTSSTGTSLRYADVREDGNSVRVDVSNAMTMDLNAQWTGTAPLTDLRVGSMTLTNANIVVGGNRGFSIRVAGLATLTSGALINVTNLTLAGPGDWELQQPSSTSDRTRIISPNMIIDQIGSVDVRQNAWFQGNIVGNMEDLRLHGSGSMINSDGYGHGANSGPGAGTGYGSNGRSGYGGSYGGYGGTGRNSAGQARSAYYGSLFHPAEKGSGGGTGYNGVGGTGGGRVDLVVSGEVLNNGYVRANGTAGAQGSNYSYAGGGGSGGAIYIDTGVLKGSGYFQANGGGSTGNDGGGGGGGRIMVLFNDWSERTNPLRMTAAGAAGYQAGSVGTAAYYDKAVEHLHLYNGWRWELDEAPFSYNGLTLADGTYVTTEAPQAQITVNGPCSFGTTARWSNTNADLQLACSSLTMENNAWLDLNSRTLTLTLTGAGVLNGNSYIRAYNLIGVGSGEYTLNSTSQLVGNVNVSGTRMTVASSARIDANSSGHPGNQVNGYDPNSGLGGGQGYGSNGRSGVGGSHGGQGRSGRNSVHGPRGTYGSVEAPITKGSGGGMGYNGRGGAGGGTIHLNMSNELRVDGYVRANGAAGAQGSNYSYAGGGGAGGSIWIEAGSFSGTGQVQAIGGGSSGNDGGAGGGGRISTCVNVANFNGVRNASGANGYGGASGTGSLYDACAPVFPTAAVVVSLGFANPAPTIQAPGALDVPLFQFQVREVTTLNGVTINSLRLNASRNGDDAAHITAVKLYDDTNGNGLVDDGEALLGTGAYGADNGTVTFTNLDFELNAGQARQLLATYDFAGVIPNNLQFRTSVSDHTSMEIVRTDTGDPVPLYGAPIFSNIHTVFITPPPYVSWVAPGVVQQGVDSWITVYGGYYVDNVTGQPAVTQATLNDPARTPVEFNVINNGRMSVKIPTTAPVGRWAVLVTTPFGANTTAGRLITVRASCDTGLAGLCSAGYNDGAGCVAVYTPGQLRESCGNGVDEDCNGEDLDCRYVDGDGDGFSPAEGDCDDTNSAVFPRPGFGCSAGGDNLVISGIPRAVDAYSPYDDAGEDQAWTSNPQLSWYQAAADTLIDSGIRIRGAGDYHEVGDSVFLEPFGDTMSAGAWVNVDSFPTTGTALVFSKGLPGGESYAIWYDAASDCWVAVVSTGGGQYRVEAPAGRATARGRWIHLAFAYTGSQLIFYKDGVPSGTVACTGNVLYDTGGLVVGGGHQGHGPLIGRIDEFMLFGRAVIEAEWTGMVSAHRQHARYSWATGQGPAIRFDYGIGPHEASGLLSGSFSGNCQLTGRSSQAQFPTFVSIVGTSNGVDIFDSLAGTLWMRLWGKNIVPFSGIDLESVDYVSMAGGKLYMGSGTGAGGVVVVDFTADVIHKWTATGVSTYNGGIGFSNLGYSYGAVATNGIKLPNNLIRRVRAWTRLDGGVQVPYTAFVDDKGVFVVNGGSGGAGAYISGAYYPEYDTASAQAAANFGFLGGCGIHPVGDQLFYGMIQRNDRSGDIVTRMPYSFGDVNATTQFSVVADKMNPAYSPQVWGKAAHPWYGDWVTFPIDWGGVNDIAILEGGSRAPGAGPNDHLIALATADGLALMNQVDGGPPVVQWLKGESNGVSDENNKYVLHGGVDECMAVSFRNGELMVGTNGAGLTRLSFDADVSSEWKLEEYWDSTTDFALPSDNVVACDAGKNLLIATDLGVADITFPEPGPCSTGLPGACGTGFEYLVGSSLRCVQTTFPTGETCDGGVAGAGSDEDCDGEVDEHPEGLGSICDVQEPIIENPQDLTVETADCDGASVVLPEPLVHDNLTANPTLINNAPEKFPFGRTTVLWTATDDDGNSSTEDQFVDVVFNGTPELVVPADVTVVATSLQTLVDLGVPSATICVPGGVTITNDAPVNGRFGVGVHTVTWTAIGSQGAPTVATQTVTVTDDEAPTIDAGPANLTFATDGDVVLPTPVVSDNATPVADLVVTHDAPAVWPIRETVRVTFTVTDLAGNTATDTVDIYVEGQTPVPPVLTLIAPTETVWYPAPRIEVIVDVTNGSCESAPSVAVQPEDLTVNVAPHPSGDGWRVTTSRVSDGIHTVVVTVTSGCWADQVRAVTTTFGVDTGGLDVVFTQLDQTDVDAESRSTWPALVEGGEIRLTAPVQDNLPGQASGLALARATIEDIDNNVTVTLHEETFTTRLPTTPPTGLPASVVSFCSNPDYCVGDALQLSAFDGAFLKLTFHLEDVVGNTYQEVYYFGSLGLREAIALWREGLTEVDTESVEAQAAVDAAILKLTAALQGYDEEKYGNMWLGIEDAEALVFTALQSDSSINFNSIMRLVAELAVPWMRVRLSAGIIAHGGNDRFAESERFIDSAAAAVGSPSAAFLALAQSWFWFEEGVETLSLSEEYDRAPYTEAAFIDANDLMALILAQMDAYLEYEVEETGERLVGRDTLAEVRADLGDVKTFLQHMVDFGDVTCAPPDVPGPSCQTDLQHVNVLLGLTTAAERLKEAEEQTVWIRNWQWGLTQIVWIYVNRDLFNAASNIQGAGDSPVFIEGFDKVDEAEDFREAYRADDFMQLLIDSRCRVVGIYNWVYEPDVAVPDYCCDEVNRFNQMDERVPVPTQCLGTVQIEFNMNGVSPTETTVVVGQEVRWINNDSLAHTVTSGDPVGGPTRDPLNSGVLGANGVFTHTFDAPGEYPYYDELNPAIVGTITVVAP